MIDTAHWQSLDRAHSWHPFTQMQDWCAGDPLVLTHGNGCLLYDSEGNGYIDGNSSIWTNIHGHNHPHINAAVRAQLERVAHTSFLGFTHPGAVELAGRLCDVFPGSDMERVFFSDNGSTALEVAIKMAVQFRQLRGESERVRFLAFADAYHGDTMGASSLGGVPLFNERFAAHQFPVTHVRSMEEVYAVKNADCITAVVIEPLVQGVAGMRAWPAGMLRELRAWCDAQGVLLILDEVLTGFGRTGTMFACQQEQVLPDFLCLAKGLTGGYLPMAATLVRRHVFDAFLGTFAEQRTFYYGHSYTANPLGCAAALASLDVFETEQTLAQLPDKIEHMRRVLHSIDLPHVGTIRQTGLIAGIPLFQDVASCTPYDWREQRGAAVCLAARRHGLLTRPIGDVLVLLPPLAVSREEITHAVRALALAIEEVCG